jgi:Mg/Co/Ni transporter MgtE
MYYTCITIVFIATLVRKELDMSLLKRIKELEKLDNDLSRVDHLEELELEKKRLREYFWEWFPHEISMSELKEINYTTYQELRAIGKFLKIKY